MMASLSYMAAMTIMMMNGVHSASSSSSQSPASGISYNSQRLQLLLQQLQRPQHQHQQSSQQATAVWSDDWTVLATSTGSDNPNSSWNQPQILTLIGLIIATIVIIGGMYWLWKRCNLPSLTDVDPLPVPSAAMDNTNNNNNGVVASPMIAMVTLSSGAAVSSGNGGTVAKPPLQAMMPLPPPAASTSSTTPVVKLTVKTISTSDDTDTKASSDSNGEDGAANGGGCGCGCDKGPCTCAEPCVAEASLPPRYGDTTNTDTNGKPSNGTFVDAGESKGASVIIEVTASSPLVPSALTSTHGHTNGNGKGHSNGNVLPPFSKKNLRASPLEKLFFCRC